MTALLWPIQSQLLRNYLALPILYVLSMASGCASLAEVQPTQIRCPASVETKVTATKQTVRVSYTEPSVSIEGTPLTDLAKTTIYYDLGNGRILAKEIPATKPTGGGQISQTITVPVPVKGKLPVRICVTATDRHGNESAMLP